MKMSSKIDSFQTSFGGAAGGQKAEYLFVAVTDEGPGLTPEEKAKLFQPFSQLRDGEARGGFNSSGLGLTFAKKIVELHNGDIGVESEKGKGSTFYFRIPLKVPVAEPSQGSTRSTAGTEASKDASRPETISSLNSLASKQHASTAEGPAEPHDDKTDTNEAAAIGPISRLHSNMSLSDFAPGSFRLSKGATTGSNARSESSSNSARLGGTRSLSFAGGAGLSSLPGIVGVQTSARRVAPFPVFATIAEDGEGGKTVSEFPVVGALIGAPPSPVGFTSGGVIGALPPIDSRHSSTRLLVDGSAGKAERQSSEEVTIVTQGTDSLSPSKDTAASPATTSPAAGTAIDIKRCIVVDDEVLNRSLFARLLERKHKHMKVVLQAESGNDCIDKTAEYVLANRKDEAAGGAEGKGLGERMNGLIDAVFTDGSMPGMDGYALATFLRQTGYTGPIMGVTGNGLKEDQDRFIDAGANAVLVKPTTAEALQAGLKKLHLA